MKFSSSYLGHVYNTKNYANLVRRAILNIHDLHIEQGLPKFDAIAFRGTSGAAMAYPLSMEMGIPLICCRKDKNHHSDTQIEGDVNIDVQKYVIVDDIISSGETVRAIIHDIDEYCRCRSDAPPPQCVGVLLYISRYWNDSIAGVRTYKI